MVAGVDSVVGGGGVVSEGIVVGMVMLPSVVLPESSVGSVV